MQMEVGGTGVGTVDRQIGRDFVQQERLVVGVKAFIGAIVERLRTIRRLELRIPVAIDCDEVLGVEAERRAIRMGEAGRLEIARSMHVHDVLRSAPLLRLHRHCEFWASWFAKEQAGLAPRCRRARSGKIRWLHGGLDRRLVLMVGRVPGTRAFGIARGLSNLSAGASARAAAAEPDRSDGAFGIQRKRRDRAGQ
ncbi:hypothetical protein ABIA00_008071 [Bradyrhizobium ottawaense]